MISSVLSAQSRVAGYIVILGGVGLAVWMLSTIKLNLADDVPVNGVFALLPRLLWLLEIVTIVLVVPLRVEHGQRLERSLRFALVILLLLPFWVFVQVAVENVSSTLLSAHISLVIIAAIAGSLAWLAQKTLTAVGSGEFATPIVQFLGIVFIFLHSQTFWTWIES